ncbi:MAG: hypothetical protein ACRCTA_06890 [Bacilli bacterium]
MQEQILDEVFFNYSCLYVGGNTLKIGSSLQPFTSIEHPHSQFISIYLYENTFLYLRQRIIYNINNDK